MRSAPPHKSNSKVRMEKLRLREGQPPAPGHTAKSGTELYYYHNPGLGIPEYPTGPRLPASRPAKNN